MSWLSKTLFGQDPSKKAMPYLEKVPGVMHEGYDPYISRGNQAYETLNPIYERMAQDPTAFIDQIMQSYKPSEGFGFRKNLLEKELRGNEAAGGYSGTSFADMQRTNLIKGLLDEDMYNWMNTVLGSQQRGMEGLSGFQQQGYGASDKLAEGLANLLGSQATLQFQGQAGKNQARSNMIGSAIGAAGMAYGKPPASTPR